MTATVEHVVRVALDSSSQRFFAHEAGVRAGADPEDVHQARVACRRLRSDLRTFHKFVRADWAEALGAELKWFGAELGAVRDIEVLHDRLRRHVSKLPEAEREVAVRSVDTLTRDWEAARSGLLAAIATPRFGAFADHLRDAANAPRFTDAASAPAASTLPKVVKKPWKKLAGEVADLGPRPADDDYHSVRKGAKRARYATEAVVSVFGDPARRFAAAMARVQDVLGEHQDAVVARHWLAKHAVGGSANDAYALGMLGQVEWRAAKKARAEFVVVWEWARRDELRSWL